MRKAAVLAAVVGMASGIRAEARKLAPATVTKRVVVTLGRTSGTDVATVRTDGSMAVAVDIVENGRGPHIDANFKFSANGTLDRFDASGHHTMGTAVAEQFARADHGKATWKSPEETGAAEGTDDSLYVPTADLPDMLGVEVRAALAHGGKVALLPAGEARVEKIGDATVTYGGAKHALVGYAIFGLDFTPTYTWMNADGTWWGTTYPWQSVVPVGADGAIAQLVAKQTAADHAREGKLAHDLAHKPPAAGLAYTHARVLDVEKGAWRADQTVVVVGDRITAVGPFASTKVPAGAETVDLAGQALLPGMIDMHAHLGDSDGVLDIASGVTTARDVGNDPDKLDEYRARFESGAAIGPRVYRMGFVEGRNEKAAASKITAETPAEAKAAVAFYAARKYDGMKIYNSVRPELVPIIADEAHKRGMKVTGHIPVHMLANEAVKAGYDGIEHINMLFLNFFATHDTDTRDTTRFTLVGEQAAAFDLEGKPMKELIALLLAHHTVIDPTLNAFEDLFVAEQGKVTPGLEWLVERLPAQPARAYLSGGLPVDAAKHALYVKSYAQMLALAKLLWTSHVTEVAGTDSLAGLMYDHELALLARAGIPPAAVLRMATLDAAAVLGIDRDTGSIAPGKRADLFVVAGDPLARITDVSRVVSTMRGGVAFPSAQLFASVGVRPYK